MKEVGIFSCKRALSHHIEMVISFSLFVLFVFFVILFVQPHDTGYLSNSIVTGLRYNFVEEASTNTITFSLFLNGAPVPVYDCYNISSLPNFIIDSGLSGISVKAKELGGFFNPSTEYDFSNNNELIVRTDEIGSYKVILSNDLPMSNPDSFALCGSFPSSQEETYGGIREEKVLSLKYLNDTFKSDYESNYEELKKRLAIPESYDFTIISQFFSVEQVIPAGTEVLSKDYIEKVLFFKDDPDGFYTAGTIESVRFTIQLWR